VYYLDTQGDFNSRSNWPAGDTSITLESGVRPSLANRWKAVETMFAWVKRYEYRLLRGHWSVPHYEHPFLVGRRGGVTIKVNTSDSPAFFDGTGWLTTWDGAERYVRRAHVPSGAVIVEYEGGFRDRSDD
jgi:hypothetical protein